MDRPWLRGYAIGVMIGALFGAFWAASAANRLPSAVSRAYDVVTVLTVVAIGVGTLRLVRMARRSAVPHGAEAIGQRRVRGGRMWGLWMVLVVAEMLAIGWVTQQLIAHHMHEYVLAAVAVMVGLHFFPLSWIFQAPEQMVTAVSMTVVGCVAMAAMAAGFDLGAPARWNIVIGTVCAAALWSTCVVGLRQTGACGRYLPASGAR